jgi:hypothetical protein
MTELIKVMEAWAGVVVQAKEFSKGDQSGKRDV